MIIELKDTKIKTIIKGEKVSKPLGFIAWSGHRAPESGINIVYGHRGEAGVFIPKSVLLELLEEIAFQEEKAKTDESKRLGNPYKDFCNNLDKDMEQVKKALKKEPNNDSNNS